MRLSKSNTDQIDLGFTMLLKDPNSNKAVTMIKDSLNDMTGMNFNVYVVSKKSNDPEHIWVMGVYPETSTLDKIVRGMNNMNQNTIEELWKKNKNWTIEIDGRIFESGLVLTNRELTAILLHEVGHIVFSNSIPNRINNIFSYELAKNSNFYYGVGKTNIFKKILVLPILELCVASHANNDSLKNELIADRFVVSFGYHKELKSAITKIINYSNGMYGSKMNNHSEASLKFSADTIEQFRKRRDKLAKRSLITLRENTESPLMEHTIDAVISDIFLKENSNEDDMRKINFFHKQLDDCNEEITLESFNKYPAIDPSTFDYIDIKTSSMKSVNDKMMLAVFIQSKIDILNRYIKLFESRSPKAKKIPYEYEDVINLKERLLNQKENVINGKIQGRDSGILVAWPEGYEG